MKRKRIIEILLSFLLTIFVIIGNSFLITGSFKFIEKNILLNIFLTVILIFIFYKLINYLFNKLDKEIIIKKIKDNKLVKLFDKNPFLFSFIIIIICWLPYIISYYPIILSPDPSFQIKQYFNIPNKYSTYNIMLDENVLITNHHPVIHTLLLGTCLKLGTIIGNDNLGLFTYSVIQIIILASVLAYTIKYMKKLKISTKYLFICLGIYALCPVFPFYSMSAVKDVIFGSLIILYIIMIYDYIKRKDKLNIKDLIKSFILMILIILFRNNGFYVIILSLPFLFFLGKKNLYKYIILFLLVIGFNISYNKIILPYYKITPTSIREVLSIPFQQTARYVKYHGKEINNKDRKKIDKLLEYDTLSERYNPDLADPVKNKYNKYATKKDLLNYFEVWGKGLIKEPITYIESTINNTYGYYYPLKTNWYFYHKFDDRIVEDGFDYHYNNLKLERKILKNYGLVFPYIPIIGLIVNIGFNFWILLFMLCYLIYQKKYKDIIFLIPSFVLFLVCIASPANTYFRYALPNIFAMPLMIGIFINIIKENKKITNKK